MTTTTDTTPMQAVAIDALRHFTTATRADGSTYVALGNNTIAPEWLRAACRLAHGGELPNDWRWLMIYEIVGAIAAGDLTDDDGAHELADRATDPYTVNLLRWLAEDIERIAYVEEARHSYGTATFVDELLRAQYYAIRDMADTILNAFRDQIAE